MENAARRVDPGKAFSQLGKEVLGVAVRGRLPGGESWFTVKEQKEWR